MMSPVVASSYSDIYRRRSIDKVRKVIQIPNIYDFLYQGAASKGEISYESPAYHHTRRTINSLIRYADDLCISGIIFGQISIKRHGLKEYFNIHKQKFKEELQALSPRQQTLITSTLVTTHVHVLAFILLTSPVFFPFIFPIHAAVKYLYSPWRNSVYFESKLKIYANDQMKKVVCMERVNQEFQKLDAAAEYLTDKQNDCAINMTA